MFDTLLLENEAFVETAVYGLPAGICENYTVRWRVQQAKLVSKPSGLSQIQCTARA